MAVTTVAITGHVLTPSGAAPTAGRATVKLSQPGSTLDGTESVRVAAETTVDLGVGGTISLALVPNDVIVPTGTYYQVTVIATLASGRRVQWSEQWQVDSAPNPINVGAVPRLGVTPGVALTIAEDWPALSAAAVAAAGASAASSAASAAEAGSSASSASSSAAAASVAAAAASSISGIYADTTAGLAATASGDYFYTVSTDPYVLILYLDNAGVAVEQGRISAATAVQALQRALTPEATDTGSGLLYIADAAGRVVARMDSAAGVYLTGIDGTAQSRLALISPPDDASGHHFYLIDSENHVIGYVDSAGGLRLPGIPSTVQAAARDATIACQNQGSVSGSIYLPASFTPMDTPLRGSERFVHAASPPYLRTSDDYWTAYPFNWATVYTMVDASMVRRARASVQFNSKPTWTFEAITVNAPGGWFSTHQFRDISPIYDRATAKWYCVVNSINVGNAFLSDGFTVFSSADGLAWDWVCEVQVVPHAGGRVWSPEFFIDDDGTVYVIVSSTPGAGWNYYVARCDDLTTFSTWSYIGQVTGTALPNSGGTYAMIDPFMMKREGVYYVVYKCESASGTGKALGQLGIAYSTSLLGPYDLGNDFVAPGSENIIGEGMSVNELPYGSPYRYRLNWDNYLNTPYRGVSGLGFCYADTNDFQTFSEVSSIGFGSTYYRHTSIVIGD